jgi:leader peptidase (prepilin peptidase)/N-methyltransferase
VLSRVTRPVRSLKAGPVMLGTDLDGQAGLWAAGLGILGAILGSFLAALVLRWTADRSIIHGRSACDSCGRTLATIDLVPVLSFVALRGRCRTCHAPINRSHLVIELLAVTIGVIAGLTSPGPAGAAGAVFGWLLLALGALDLAAFWLPDRLTATLAAIGLATGLAGFAPDLEERLWGGIAGFGALWLVGEGYRRLRGREGLGGGDPKLFGAIGLSLGWRLLPAVLLIASLIGLGVVMGAALRGRPLARDAALPFGVFLAAAAYPAWLVMVRFAA